MNKFLQYLRTAKNSLKTPSTFDSLHVVLGNESCDMDSCVSSIVLAYFLHTNRYSCDIAPDTLVIAVQNVPYEHFLLRTDNCYILQQIGIPLDLLIYKDNINLPDMLCKGRLTCSLVDHHVLSGPDQILSPTVKRIIDHRPVDPTVNWSDRNVHLRIQEVGSCATLIADDIYQANSQFLFKELAYLIYETMVYDTIALLPENGKAKELDLMIASKLESDFGFTEDRKILYKELWKAHNDVSHLTPHQMLYKDLKVVDGVPLPGLPMLVETFLKLPDAYAAVDKFRDDHKASVVILIGLDARDEVKRDVGVLYKSDELKDRILDKLKSSDDFDFNEVQTDLPNTVCLSQGNVKLSRKQIIPLIKQSLASN